MNMNIFIYDQAYLYCYFISMVPGLVLGCLIQYFYDKNDVTALDALLYAVFAPAVIIAGLIYIFFKSCAMLYGYASNCKLADKLDLNKIVLIKAKKQKTENEN